jgi:hypothetical protein
VSGAKCAQHHSFPGAATDEFGAHFASGGERDSWVLNRIHRDSNARRGQLLREETRNSQVFINNREFEVELALTLRARAKFKTSIPHLKWITERQLTSGAQAQEHAEIESSTAFLNICS